MVEELQGLPTLPQWWQLQPNLQRMQVHIEHLIPENKLSGHPLRSLRSSLVHLADSIDRVKQLTQQASDQLDQMERAIKSSGIPSDQWTTVERIVQLLGFLDLVTPFASGENLQLLDPRLSRTVLFRNGQTKLAQLRSELELLRKQNHRWKKKLSAVETRIAIPQARAFLTSLTRWVSPAWWRLRSVLNTQYDFSNFSIRPTFVQILEELDREYLAEDVLQKAMESLALELKISCSLEEIQQALQSWEVRFPNLAPSITTVHRALMKSPKAPDIIHRWRQRLDCARFETDLVNEPFERFGYSAVTCTVRGRCDL